MNIAIAGASGFIGKNLIAHLLEHTNHHITAFSRSSKESDNPRITNVQVDLYSLSNTIRAFENCDAAVYLVHSMAPSSRLSQGHFRDYDFILADNFARAAKENGVKHIVYVGGIIPNKEKLSIHLQSRLEVEELLRSTGISVTTLRCGLVIGQGGSSFQIVVKLLQRLPVMVLPKWMRTKSSPIFVDDLVHVIVHQIEQLPHKNLLVDAGLGQPASYKDILLTTAKAMGKKPFLIDVPSISPRISRLWVSVVTGAPRELVYPLIDSVKHEMVTDASRTIPDSWNIKLHTLEEAVQQSIEANPKPTYAKAKAKAKRESLVRSIQRMPLPKAMTAKEVARAYTKWLPSFLKPILRLETTATGCRYFFRGMSKPLLELGVIESSSSATRYIFQVEHGLLVGKKNFGRFEFRESPDRECLIVALHDFKPALPWFIYRSSQAIVHQIVMSRFSKSLGKLKARQQLSTRQTI